MLGWEFPPHISGGLGTACLGLTQLLQDVVDSLNHVALAAGLRQVRHSQQIIEGDQACGRAATDTVQERDLLGGPQRLRHAAGRLTREPGPQPGFQLPDGGVWGWRQPVLSDDGLRDRHTDAFASLGAVQRLATRRVRRSRRGEEV